MPLILMLGPRLLPIVIRYARLIWRLTFDKRVNLVVRALVPLALLYALSPLDLLKDTIPILGRFDDLIVLGLALFLLVKMSPPDVVDQHLGRIPNRNRPEDNDPNNVVDGSSRVVDEE